MVFLNVFRPRTRDATPESVEEVKAILASLHRERGLAEAELRGIADARETALVEAQSDAEILAIDARADSIRLTIERLDAAEPALLGRLDLASSAARRARWKALTERYEPVEVRFCDTMGAAVKALDELQRVRLEMEIEFMAESRVFAYAPNVVSADLLDRFKFEIERRHDAERPRPAPAEALAPPPPPAPRHSLQKPKAPPQAPRQPPRAPFVDTAEEGERLVTILRDGYEAPDGRHCRAGDVIAIAAALAERVVRRGAAEFARDG